MHLQWGIESDQKQVDVNSFGCKLVHLCLIILQSHSSRAQAVQAAKDEEKNEAEVFSENDS